MKLPISPVCTKFDIFDIWLYSLQDWWRTVDGSVKLLATGKLGNFNFRPVNVIQMALQAVKLNLLHNLQHDTVTCNTQNVARYRHIIYCYIQ